MYKCLEGCNECWKQICRLWWFRHDCKVSIQSYQFVYLELLMISRLATVRIQTCHWNLDLLMWGSGVTDVQIWIYHWNLDLLKRGSRLANVRNPDLLMSGSGVTTKIQTYQCPDLELPFLSSPDPELCYCITSRAIQGASSPKK